MANKKITDYPVGATLQDTDLVDVSSDNGDGTFTSKSFTIAQLKEIAENLANADLEQTEATRQYNIVATQLLEFINGDLKMTQTATNYVYWEDGELKIRGGSTKGDRPLQVFTDANALLFYVDFDETRVLNTLNLESVTQDSLDYSLGLKGNEVVKNFQENTIFKAFLDQSGTSAPTKTEWINNTGETIVSTYSAVGTYILTGFNGTMLGNVEFNISNTLVGGATALIETDPTGIICSIKTYDETGTLANDLLTNTVLTIKKY